MTAPQSGNDFWQLADGPYGGTVRELVTLPDGTILARGGPSYGGPVFRSTDGGLTWERPGPEARGMVASAGTGGDAYLFDRHCLWVSRDSGLSWTSHCLDADSLDIAHALWLTIEDLAVTTTGRLYAVVFALEHFECQDGTTSLWYSDDGHVWHAAENRISDDTGLAVLGDSVLVRHSRRSLSTLVGTGTWRPLPSLPNSLSSLFGHPRDTMFAGTTNGLYQLADTSADWVALELSIDEHNNQIIYDVERLQDGRLCIAGPAVQCRRGSGAFEMLGSASRLQHRLGDVQAVASTADNQLVAGGYWRGIYRYRHDTDTWQMSVDGMRQHALHALAESTDGQLYGFAGSNLYVSDDGGSSWQLRAHGLEWSSEDDAGVLFAGGTGTLLRAAAGRIYRSTDGGLTWRKAARVHDDVGGFAQRADGTIIGVSAEGVYSAPSDGDTWQQIGMLDTTARGHRPYYVRDVAQRSGGTIYAATDYGVQRSTDSGASWEFVLESEAGGNADAAVAVTSTNAVVAIYPSAVFRSTDAGRSWTQAQSFQWPDVIGARAAIAAGPDSTVYFSVGAKLWISVDDGQTWSRSEGGSEVGLFRALHVTNEGYLLAGAGATAYRSRRTTPTSAQDGTPPVPSRALLRPVAPNPVHRRATVRYHLSAPSEVRLALYDVLGRRVRMLTEGHYNAGRHEVHLDATDLAPGTYFARLLVPERVWTQPLVVVR